jgi:hypothetical protein
LRGASEPEAFVDELTAEEARRVVSSLREGATRLLQQGSGESGSVKPEPLACWLPAQASEAGSGAPPGGAVRIQLPGVTEDVLCLSADRALGLADALEAAVERLSQAALLVVSELHVGVVPARAEDASARELEVAVEGGVFEVSAPRVELCLSGPEGAGQDTWWLMDTEAEQLARFLLQASREALRGDALGGIPVRALPASSEGAPWLTVSVEPRPASHGEHPPGVLLRFDDELTRQSGDNARWWLSPPEAERLRALLLQALQLEAVTPPHIYVPPQPGAVVVAQLRWEES